MEKQEILSKLNNYISSKELEGYFIVDKNESSFTAVLSKGKLKSFFHGIYHELKKLNPYLPTIIVVLSCIIYPLIIVWPLIFLYIKNGRIKVYLDNSTNFLVAEDIQALTSNQLLRLKQFGIIVIVLGVLLALLTQKLDFKRGDWLYSGDPRVDQDANIVFLILGIVIAVIGVIMIVISLNQKKYENPSKQRIE